MKQYGKNRTPAFPLYWCNQKADCCWSPYCGKECCKTRHKQFARKDAKGRVMIASRWIQETEGMTAKELVAIANDLADGIAEGFKTVTNYMAKVNVGLAHVFERLSEALNG